MRKIFIPVLKTKRSSEKNALKALLPTIQEYEDIVPYLEIIKDIGHSDVLSYFKILEENTFFAQTKNKSEITSLITLNNAIPVFKVDRSSTELELLNFINDWQSMGRKIAIRIDDADERYIDAILSKLSTEDYLFVDIGKTPYESSGFLMDLVDKKHECKIIIHSNERKVSATGSDYNAFNKTFGDDKYFNNSIIEAIKSGSFEFDGFSSFCAAKNDLTEEIKIATEVYGYILTYNFVKNNFYILTTTIKKHISTVYNDLLNIIISDYTAFVDKYYAGTPISKGIIDDNIKIGKLSCQKKITIEIVHYIEEIINGLFK